MKYILEIGLGAMIYIPSFRYSTVSVGGGFTETHTPTFISSK
jgi:hypothetical protein